MKTNLLAFVLVGIAASGCAWRTRNADHIVGPVLYRFSAPPAVLQTAHFPLLLEGGRQWGISIGCAERISLVATQPGAVRTTAEDAPQGWLIHPAPQHWQCSWIYLRAPFREPPEFIRRTIIGAHGGAGTEERAVSIGYSSMATTTPRHEAVYQLDFHSRRPLDSALVVNPLPASRTRPPPNEELR